MPTCPYCKSSVEELEWKIRKAKSRDTGLKEEPYFNVYVLSCPSCDMILSIIR